MGDNGKNDETRPDSKPDYGKLFRETSHEIITQDASFQLLKPGKNIRENLSKTRFPDYDYMIRFNQLLHKANEYDIGDEAQGKHKDQLNAAEFCDNLLISLTSIKGFSRLEFNMSLSRLFAPSIVELPETGKISGDGKAHKQLGVFKARDQKQEDGKEQ